MDRIHMESREAIVDLRGYGDGYENREKRRSFYRRGTLGLPGEGRAGGGKAIGFKEFRPSVESAEESGS